MLRSALKVIIILIGVLIILNMASPGFAQDPAKKLGRGLANILTGWIELPKNIYETSAETNPVAGLTIGLVKGLGMTIVRTGAGIYDTATFPFPLPQNYKPVLEPEYVFKDSEGK